MSNVKITSYNVSIDSKSFIDQSINHNAKTYENMKTAAGQVDYLQEDVY